MTTSKSSGHTRFHFMDTARALCMVLGIPYHAALIYAAGSWRISSPDESFTAEMIARASQSFRMPTFFIISGFFAVMMLTRRPVKQWISDRIVRLMVPLFFTALLISPVMIFAQIMGDRAIADTDKITVFIQTVSRPSNLIAHLWFLAALTWMCLITAATTSIGKLIPGLPGNISALLNFSYCGPLLIFGMIIWEAFVKNLIMTSGIPLYLAFSLINIPAILQYFPYFIFGIILFLNVNFRNSFLDMTAFCIVGGVIGIGLYCIYPELGIDWSYSGLIKPVCAILVSRFILSVLKKYADQENAFIRKIVDRSFTIYLFHMPFIVVMGFSFLYIQIPPFLKFLIISVITFAVCYALAGIVGKFGVLRFMFNGIVSKRKMFWVKWDRIQA